MGGGHACPPSFGNSGEITEAEFIEHQRSNSKSGRQEFPAHTISICLRQGKGDHGVACGKVVITPSACH